MASSTEVLSAFRELAQLKQLDRTELRDLIRDGVLAALAKKFGPNVRAEIDMDEMTGQIRITVLKEVVAVVEDPSRQIVLEEARWEDPAFEVGDVLEIDVDFAEFGRTAVQAAKQRIIQRVREGERSKIRDEFSTTTRDIP